MSEQDHRFPQIFVEHPHEIIQDLEKDLDALPDDPGQAMDDAADRSPQRAPPVVNSAARFSAWEGAVLFLLPFLPAGFGGGIAKNGIGLVEGGAVFGQDFRFLRRGAAEGVELAESLQQIGDVQHPKSFAGPFETGQDVFQTQPGQVFAHFGNRSESFPGKIAIDASVVIAVGPLVQLDDADQEKIERGLAFLF